MEFSGKGGFGRVFGAKDMTTKKRVAIKKLPHVTEKDKRNNWCEIGFLATCQHPNIVRFLSAWEMEDEVWIVMEFLDGGTLHEAIKVHQFSERHIAYIAREVLQALHYLHSNKLVHRDLKSANVMMSVDGEIKLIDFGLCADISEGERTQMVGSPFWMPPEMIRREPHGCPVHYFPLHIHPHNTPSFILILIFS
jgi:serine/threonine protein kinase